MDSRSSSGNGRKRFGCESLSAFYSCEIVGSGRIFDVLFYFYINPGHPWERLLQWRQLLLILAQGAHLNVAVVGAAVIGGSYFGDNLSMISDTTISAAEGCGSEMKDKFKMNFFIALPAAIVAMILYSIFGGVGSGAIEAGSYSIIEVLPYFIVLIAALMGVNVAVVLLSEYLHPVSLDFVSEAVDF